MKRLFSLLMIGLAFCLLADTANAQLNFTNNTPCPVRVRGIFSAVGTCVAPYCNSPWIPVPPFGAVIIPGGPCGGFPGPLYFFRRVQINDGLGGIVTVDYCTAPVMNYPDCALVPRILQFTSPFAATTF